jgi:hypothetical protein
VTDSPRTIFIVFDGGDVKDYIQLFRLATDVAWSSLQAATAVVTVNVDDVPDAEPDLRDAGYAVRVPRRWWGVSFGDLQGQARANSDGEVARWFERLAVVLDDLGWGSMRDLKCDIEADAPSTRRARLRLADAAEAIEVTSDDETTLALIVDRIEKQIAPCAATRGISIERSSGE